MPCAGEVAPLECNLDAVSGISYTKGCYIGQERNSYTHYRYHCWYFCYNIPLVAIKDLLTCTVS